MVQPRAIRRPARGATINVESTRFNLPQTEADGDWLDAREAIDGAPPPPRTSVTIERPRTIISRNSSPDVPFDRSINPYRGCEQPCNGCAMSGSAVNLWKAETTSGFSYEKVQPSRRASAAKRPVR